MLATPDHVRRRHTNHDVHYKGEGTRATLAMLERKCGRWSPQHLQPWEEQGEQLEQQVQEWEQLLLVLGQDLELRQVLVQLLLAAEEVPAPPQPSSVIPISDSANHLDVT